MMKQLNQNNQELPFKIFRIIDKKTTKIFYAIGSLKKETKKGNGYELLAKFKTEKKAQKALNKIVADILGEKNDK